MDDINRRIEKQAEDVQHFKDQKVRENDLALNNKTNNGPAQMSELLDHNVKLSDLQSKFSSVFETTAEKKRVLENMEERKIEKRFYLIIFRC